MANKIFIGVVTGVATLAVFEFIAKPILKNMAKADEGEIQS
jgi:hypothetical protein